MFNFFENSFYIVLKTKTKILLPNRPLSSQKTNVHYNSLSDIILQSIQSFRDLQTTEKTNQATQAILKDKHYAYQLLFKDFLIDKDKHCAYPKTQNKYEIFSR